MSRFEIPYYHSYISENLAESLLAKSRPVSGVKGLSEVGTGGGLETTEALQFLVDLYEGVKGDLKKVLHQREVDRKFIDERVKAYSQYNCENGYDVLSPEFKTIIGLEDGQGRVILGPLREDYAKAAQGNVAPVPEFLKGPHVTLFGPPDNEKMAINAMNAYHRRLENEPPIVEELLSSQSSVPKWGADDEDSKTPLRQDLIDAAVNLTACFDGSIKIEGNEKYQLAKDHLAIPIKRFPGLALPSTFLFLNGNPIPLHLYDFALHLFKNWHNPESLVFYVPKLENEEEAQYIHKMVSLAEKMISEKNPSYTLGSVRLMIVLENPRAILRTHEIMDALHPFFIGASLGWHDYLGSMARIFKEESNYRIPVKADPDIVIKYIKASHLLLADVVGSRGGIKVGGMYGILPLDNDLQSDSFQMTILGFIKDVITQMKRNLTGYWVAHPDFVRLGIALVEAWRQHSEGDSKPLETLVTSLLVNKHHKTILDFIHGEDIEGLDIDDPNYVRSLIVADIKESDFIANNDPEEIRYNVFQSLQYITDWLSGNGCVALPAIVNGVPVRVMDDLATAERSRWEVWHELYHGRFSKEEFIRIVHEEMHFIRKDLSNDTKIVQVKYNETSKKWYPLALRIMIKLMTDPNPAEFATELLMPFTVETIRNADDPWKTVTEMDPGKYDLDPEVERFHYYFEACGCDRFAREMAKNPVLDLKLAEKLIHSFDLDEVLQAASFHGDIGERKSTLDSKAAHEQAQVLNDLEETRQELQSLGQSYLEKFGFKFLISAQGKPGHEILKALKERLERTKEEEFEAAKQALWEITEKRIKLSPPDFFLSEVKALMKEHGVPSASLSVVLKNHTQDIGDSDSLFQVASLSKTLASCFAVEYFRKSGISLQTSVNTLFAKTSSDFRIQGEYGDQVTVEHLLNHTALNMHYVNGFKDRVPELRSLLNGQNGYEKIEVFGVPGEKFNYSGGGFLVLEHLIESLEEKSIDKITQGFFEELDLKDLNFSQRKGDHLCFPAFAAGAMGTTRDYAQFLHALTHAFQNIEGTRGISHDTAVEMLYGEDRGSQEFMGALMGLGVFIARAGDNKIMIHQGANDGFRALYLHCFSGPDTGKGFVICAKGDNNAVPFVAKCAQKLILALGFRGIDTSRFLEEFDSSQMSQEEIVNLGYKSLIFDAFESCLPKKIEGRTQKDPLAKYNLLANAKIKSVTNQSFGRAENLISLFEPVFEPEDFCPQGKVMDSWETERHNRNEFHELVIELEKKSKIRFVRLSTKFHDGNHVESVCLEGDHGEILPLTKLLGHSELKIDLGQTHETKNLRVKAYPDGGLTRLGIYQEVPDPSEFNGKSESYSEPIPRTVKPMALPFEVREDDALLESVSDEHYGQAKQVLSPYPSIHMFDGFESARSRNKEHFEEIVIDLRKPKSLSAIIFDFKYFINNCPKLISIQGLLDGDWVLLQPESNVKPFAGNQKKFSFENSGKFQKLKINVYPDGGINRIKVLPS